MMPALAASVAQAIEPSRHVVRWAVSLHRDGVPEVEFDATASLGTASMGKVFLLAEVARRIETGELDPALPLATASVLPVGDSGLWQHFSDVPLTVAAAAVLVASVSDNLATNVLLAHLGLQSVQAMSVALGMPDSRMLDRIRDQRTPGDPSEPSVGRSCDLARFMHLVGTSPGSGEGWQARLRAWLSLGADLSMVASAFSLDPLAHAMVPLGLGNKTGTDVGVRADAGYLAVEGVPWSYAVIANWGAARAADDNPAIVAAVLAAMRGIGESLLASAER